MAQQLLRHGAQAGTDLDHGIVRLRPDGGRDVVEDEAVMQEVLAKAFAGNVFHNVFSINAVKPAQAGGIG
ncbi:hypothetical protein D3C72_1479290 [compost metagenome]